MRPSKGRVGVNTRAVHKVRGGLSKAAFYAKIASQQAPPFRSWATGEDLEPGHVFDRGGLARKVLERGKYSERHPLIQRFGKQLASARSGVHRFGPTQVRAHVRGGRPVRGYTRGR